MINEDDEAETDPNIKVKVKTPKKKKPRLPRKKIVIEEQPIPEVSPALKALIDKNLLEIFMFYAKKHLNQRGDFEQLNAEKTVLHHNGYANFCKDFKLPISGQHITEVFKKAALSNQTHEYEQFNNSITRLGMTINREKAAEKKKQLAAIRQEQKRRAEPKEKKKEKADIDDISGLEIPQANTSFRNKFSAKSDEDLSDIAYDLYVEMKTLEIIKEEAARMLIIDILEVYDPEKYRPKMIGYGGYKNFEILDIEKQTKQFLKVKDTQSQQTYGAGPAPPRKKYKPPQQFKPRGHSQLPRMSPNSSLSGNIPASIANENAYSDIETKQTTVGNTSHKQPIKTVDEKAERQKLQEKYARLRKERQVQEVELAR